jgi:tetratricopeptide (TPR) repeat protein
LLAGTLLATLALAPASGAVRLASGDPLRTYVQARAAALSGDHNRAAELLAALAQSQPDQVDIAKKALSEAIGAGNMPLAISLVGNVPPANLTSDARLLMVVDEVKRRRLDRAMPWLQARGDAGDLTFLAPLITAWDFAERGNADQALQAIDQIPANSLMAPLRNEERALLLLKFKRPADAEPFARRAIGNAGSREDRLRLAFADGFLEAGDKARALAMLDGMGGGETVARKRVQSGKLSGQGIDNLPEALSEVLTAFTGDLVRIQRAAAPIGLVQVARYANAQNSSATMLLALLLDAQQRDDEALAVLRSVPPGDGLISPVRDIEVRILDDQKKYDEAYQIAAAASASPDADADDFTRLGDVYSAMKRHSQAADAYGRAVQLATAAGHTAQLWTLQLLRASALQDAGRWPEAKQALEAGLANSPDQPLLLNFLGYAKLERNEDVDAAEAMIRKASDLAPDDASITDSLGWAEFKRGKTDDAIATLQRAAEKDPDQAEIQEHLGDALYKSGRRYEARFAWSAALVTAEDDMATRVKAKLASGLTSSNAAP